MSTRNRIRIVLILVVLCVSSTAWGQMQIGQNTTINANASASVGYNAQIDGTDVNSLAYGFNGNITGVYYDPRFLNFNINPYYGQSRLNSSFSSISSASGVSATANFLSNSTVPMQFSYSRDHNSEGTFNVPNQLGQTLGAYKTVGDDQSFAFSAAYLPEDWPSLQGSFSHGGATYEVIGQPGTGTSSTNAFGLSSAYQVWNTNLSGGYNGSFVSSHAPLFGSSTEAVDQNTNQGTWQFAANRPLPFKAATASFNFSHSHLNSDYSSTQTNTDFNTLSSALTLNPTRRMSVNLNMGYSSNASAQLLSSILNGNSPNGAIVGTDSSSRWIATPVSKYLNYGASVSYNIAKDWSMQANVTRRTQGSEDMPDYTSSSMGLGTTWSHAILGGTFGASYGFSYYIAPSASQGTSQQQAADNSTFYGHTATASYSRSLLGWSASSSFSYSRNLTNTFVGLLQTGYSANGSISRRIAGWSLGLNSGYSTSRVDGLALSDSKSFNSGISLSRRTYGIGGTYSRNSGSAVQIGNTLVSVPVPLPGFPPLMSFNGQAYAVSGNWNPIRRWSISGSYSNMRYYSQNVTIGSNSTSSQYFFRSDYTWRQLHIVGGYSHLRQGVGATFAAPSKLDTVYFGVSRYFDVF